MVHITADDKMAAVLSATQELAEVRDSGGKILGFFAPINLEHAQSYAQAAAHFDPAEIERRKRSGEESYPFEVVRRRLELLDAEVERRQAAGEPPLTSNEVVEFIDRLRRQDRAAG